MSKKYDVAPLSAEEKRWVRDLERVLLRAPERLALIAIGDKDLSVFSAEHGTDDIHDGHASRDGRVLASVRSGCVIHGVSG